MKFHFTAILFLFGSVFPVYPSDGHFIGDTIPHVSETVESFLDELDTWHGVPYLQGGMSKDNGIDAAGLVRSVYNRVCGLALPSTPDSLRNCSAGKTIELFDEDLLPGDILFMKKNTGVTEAAIYIGDEDDNNIIIVHPDNGVQSASLSELKSPVIGVKRFVRFAESLKLRGEGYLAKPVETPLTEDDLLAEINTWIGTPYAWGNNKKHTGTDCSGFVTSIFRTLFNVTLPRTSSAMWTDPIGQKIDDLQSLRPGDVLFFKYGNRVGHVAIYLGKNKKNTDEIVHAKNEKEPLGIDEFRDGGYWKKQYSGAKRFVILSGKFSSGGASVSAKSKTETQTLTDEKLYRSSQPEINSVSILRGKDQLTITWTFKNGSKENQIAKRVIDEDYEQTFGEKYPEPVFYRYDYVWKNENHTGTLLEDKNGILRAEIDENHDTEEIEIFSLTPVRKPSAGTKKAASVKTDSLGTDQSNKTGVFQTGEASYYAHQFHGRKTANGETFDMYKMTAAHRSLPFGTKVKVTNLQNQRQITVRINDRGPYAKGRIIDVSYEAAKQLDMIRSGIADVTIELQEE